MKKLLIATLIAGCLTLTACDDKEKIALTEQTQKQAQTIEQLNEQVTNLQKQVVDLADNQILHTELDVLFDKKEELKFEANKDEEDTSPTTAEVRLQINLLKTNVDWLNELLLNRIGEGFSVTDEAEKSVQDKHPKSFTRQQIVDLLEKTYAEGLSEAKEYRSPLITDLNTQYHGQIENIATFSIYNYNYSGGAHGIFGTDFLNIDLNKKAVLGLEDLIEKKELATVKKYLWETYTNQYVNDNGEKTEPFTSETEFYVSNAFYFSPNGITFVYPPYAIGPYAEGQKELTLDWFDAKFLLKPEYKFLAPKYNVSE